MPNFGVKINKLMRLSFVVLLFAAACLSPFMALHAQRAREDSVRLVSIMTRPTADGTAVTLSADTPLTRTQMWKDVEGFHIVLPYVAQSRLIDVPRGVQVRQVGGSLEVLVQTQPGADVRVQPLFNRLTLLVNGVLDITKRESFDQSTIQGPCPQELYGTRFKEISPCDKRSLIGLVSPSPVETPSPSQSQQTTGASAASANALPNAPGPTNLARQTDGSVSGSTSINMSLAEEEAALRNRRPLASAEGNGAEQVHPVNVPKIAYDEESDLPKAKVQVKKEESVGFLSSVFSPVGLVAFLGPGMLLVLLYRQRRLTRMQNMEAWDAATATKQGEHKLNANGHNSSQGGSLRVMKSRKGDAAQTFEMHSMELTLDGPQSSQSMTSPALPDALFSAEQIKQEVSLLLKGQPYSPDVLSSRAADDRKVFEACLVQSLNASGLHEDERERARRALEENGFVLRRGALLLSARDAKERAQAARTLAEMSSPSSIPFLLEAINDPEATVRTEAIGSIGVLKEPSAIGPLLDAARRYPDMSITLLRNVLGACSFEGIGRLNAATAQLSCATNGENIFAEKVRQRALVSDMEDVPESVNDENLAQALIRLEDADVNVRVAATRMLGQFCVRSSLTALTSIALLDLEPSVRAAAANSLGNINHPSVYAHLLIAHADESREVKAAAARSLSRLNIDRAEAFVRLLEIGDEQILRDVMRACLKTGMISQAVGKLASTDRHQAYEAFSLLSLLEKLKETQVLQGAIERCQDNAARSAARAMFGLNASITAAS